MKLVRLAGVHIENTSTLLRFDAGLRAGAACSNLTVSFIRLECGPGDGVHVRQARTKKIEGSTQNSWRCKQ
jgi:hypothetical protein